MAMTQKAREKMLQRIDKITGGDHNVREWYSGRGMFGGSSSVAVTTVYGPSSSIGKALAKLGMCCDAMGLNYVYYTRS